MEKKRLLFILWVAAMMMIMCACWMEGEEEAAKQRTNLATGEVKIEGEKAMDSANEKANSLGDWASNKFSQ